MSDDDEPGAHAKAALAAVHHQQAERACQAGHGDRQRQHPFQHARQPAAAARQGVAARHSRQQRDDHSGKGDFQRQPDGVLVEPPDLHHPAQGEAAAYPHEIVAREPCHDRHSHRDDEEEAEQQRGRHLQGDGQALHGDLHGWSAHVPVATVWPFSPSAHARTNQVTAPSTRLSVAAVSKSALRVNAV
ncbi:hypothetical protein GALL_520710 [mine drainage metagenome]|uniref:Uncharacterized protein n=1 Tax=mine drainage metagenome TaxID=410659 RepID=A0A1J5P5A3_9ZZZZ